MMELHSYLPRSVIDHCVKLSRNLNGNTTAVFCVYQLPDNVVMSVSKPSAWALTFKLMHDKQTFYLALLNIKLCQE